MVVPVVLPLAAFDIAHADRRDMRVRLLLVLLTVGLGSLCLSACGAGGDHSATSRLSSAESGASVASAGKDADDDQDNPSGKHYDEDDYAVLLYGEPADAADRRALTRLTSRYYTAASADHGLSVCRLIYSKIAHSVVSDFGASSGLSGKTCASFMTQLLRRDRHELRPVREVTDIRVEGDRGSAVLRFVAMNDRHILFRREHGIWKLGVLLPVGLP